jgi:mycothiol S-conjugate amidase
MRRQALQAEMGRRGLDRTRPGWAGQAALLGAHDPWPMLPVTTRVACGDFFETGDRALRAHKSQVDPDGFWFAYPPEVRRAAWPTEDFHLARSLVSADLPEDDLFAGVDAAGDRTACPALATSPA